MKTTAEFLEHQPDYHYFKINDGRADVIVYHFIEEKEQIQMDTSLDEETKTNHAFIYQINVFSVDPKEITEEMIKSNHDYYLNYSKQDESTIVNDYLIDNDYRLTCIELGLIQRKKEKLYGTYKYL